MTGHGFTLKSGAKLQVSTCPFEQAVALMEAVKTVTIGLDKSLEIDNSLVLANPVVRKALYEVFPSALYDGVAPVSVQLFDDPKWGERARGDYFEICAKLIEVHCKPFFLTISSASTQPPKPPSENLK